MSAADLELRDLRVRYGDWRLSLSLTVRGGELLALLGPSGCGKTTTLMLIAGFLGPESGDIVCRGASLLDQPPERRNVGMVFQDYALFPHMNVAQNVGFGLRMRGVARAERERRVADLLALAHLEQYGRRYPHQLSGGEQQRVAMLRALAPNPDLLLLDEPLSALDMALRREMRREIRLLQRRLGTTTLYVTHDQVEALAIADRVAVMRGGLLEQLGTPWEVYRRPRSPFVARFLRCGNVVEGRAVGREGTAALVEAADRRLWVAAEPDGQGRVECYFRPEDARPLPEGEDAAPGFNAVPGIVTEVEYRGDRAVVTVRTALGEWDLIASPEEMEWIERRNRRLQVVFAVEACRGFST